LLTTRSLTQLFFFARKCQCDCSHCSWMDSCASFEEDQVLVHTQHVLVVLAQLSWNTEHMLRFGLLVCLRVIDTAEMAHPKHSLRH